MKNSMIIPFGDQPVDHGPAIKIYSRLLRTLNGTKISDKISVQSMLNTFNLLSVNQLAAEIKLIETWKSVNVKESPIQLEPFKANINEHQLRPQPNRIFKDDAKLAISHRCSKNLE